MRHLVALLPLLVACSSDPSPPSDASAADVAVTDASDAAGAGSCPELARRCGTGIDSCAGVGGSNDIRGCLGGAYLCRPIPRNCWTCPDGSRLWRTEEITAFGRAFGDSGVCPAVDGGVSDPHF